MATAFQDLTRLMLLSLAPPALEQIVSATSLWQKDQMAIWLYIMALRRAMTPVVPYCWLFGTYLVTYMTLYKQMFTLQSIPESICFASDS